MVRPRRIHFPDACYHVTLRGNHREPIFDRPDDRTRLDVIVTKVMERFEGRLHGYCWMTNHLHLIVQVAHEPLSRIMHRIASRYAREFQRQRATTGHLFERRYHSRLVSTDQYLLQLLRYVHYNPVRAGLASSPDGYQWSSHGAYMLRAGGAAVTTGLALNALHVDPRRQQRAYRDWMAIAPTDMALEPAVDGKGGAGDAAESDRVNTTPVPESTAPRPTLQDLITDVCRQRGISPDALRSPSKRRELSHARLEVALRASHEGICTLSAVAHALNRSVAAISSAVQRAWIAAPGGKR